jgi:hypothetical protein
MGETSVPDFESVEEADDWMEWKERQRQRVFDLVQHAVNPRATPHFNSTEEADAWMARIARRRRYVIAPTRSHFFQWCYDEELPTQGRGAPIWLYSPEQLYGVDYRDVEIIELGWPLEFVSEFEVKRIERVREEVARIRALQRAII